MNGAPEAKPSVLLRELDDETVLFDETSGTTFHLNTTASMIWCLCDGEHSEQRIADELLAVFPDADPERIRAEVRSTLDRFSADNLLV
jgi:hypothetical protein